MRVSSTRTMDAEEVLLRKAVVRYMSLMVLKEGVDLIPKSPFLEEEEHIGRLPFQYRDNQTFPLNECRLKCAFPSAFWSRCPLCAKECHILPDHWLQLGALIDGGVKTA